MEQLAKTLAHNYPNLPIYLFKILKVISNLLKKNNIYS